MKRGLVLSLAPVLGLGVASFAQTLSGSWDTAATIVPSPVSLGIRSEFIVTYAVSGWSFTSDTLLTQVGWSSQRFDASGALGGFALGSTLTFNPTTVAFTSWTATGSLSLVGVAFSGVFTLTPDNTTLVLRSSGTVGTVGAGVAVTLGDPTVGSGCDLNWTGVDITVGFPLSCADVTSAIGFDCTGFKAATFGVTGIAIPNLPWVTLDATLTFQTQTKSLVVSPKFDLGDGACFDVYITQAQTGSLTLDGMTISGIGLRCEIGGTWFTGVSYWGAGTKPGLLAGTPYWEAYQIATLDDGCCGPFNFDVTVYFLEGGVQLFDVSKVVANMEVQISTQFTFSTGITIDLAAAPNAFTLWTLGFLVEW